jgi:hypothetical protein
VSALEPLICFLPEEKSLVQRYLSWLYFHLVNFLAFPVEFLKRVYLGTMASHFQFLLFRQGALISSPQQQIFVVTCWAYFTSYQKISKTHYPSNIFLF